jgi:hypothetical protein
MPGAPNVVVALIEILPNRLSIGKPVLIFL